MICAAVLFCLAFIESFVPGLFSFAQFCFFVSFYLVLSRFIRFYLVLFGFLLVFFPLYFVSFFYQFYTTEWAGKSPSR